MKKVKIALALLSVSIASFFVSCSRGYDVIPIPMTTQFEPNLTAYQMFQGEMKDLIPAPGVELLELG
ncbi:MAG: hypothetical protein AAFR59_05685, partial [Bacteroidota bacterium]